MPHSSRRNRKPQQSKRIISETEDGWQRIERTPTYHPHRQPQVTSTITKTLPPIDHSLTVERLIEEHKRCKQQWVTSSARTSIQQVLERRRPSEGWPLDKAVCVALGSLSLSWAHRNRSVWQLVMFVDMVDMIQSRIKDKKKLKLYAQEPRFTPLDQDFFKAMDITVLQQPEAEELVDEGSFTFIPCLEWINEVPFIVKARDMPLYVTSSMHWVAEEAGRMKQHADTPPSMLQDCDDAMAASRAVLDTHDEYKSPQADFADGHSLSFGIYTLKQEDEG